VVARLCAELGGAQDQSSRTQGESSRTPVQSRRVPGEVAPRIGNVRASGDERTVRSAHGGLGGVLLDLDIQTP